MDLVPLNDFIQTEEYKKFINENPEIGYLKVEVFTAYKAVPISNAEVLITKNIDDKAIIMYRGYTNSSGMIDNIELPAPKSNTAFTPASVPEYTLYDLTVIHKDYAIFKKNNIAMFGGIKVIQYAKMTPNVDLKGVDTFGN